MSDTCPMCGTPVRVVTSEEGTSSYEPVRADALDAALLDAALANAKREIERLREALKG